MSKSIATIEAAIAAGMHVELRPDGMTVITDNKDRPTIDKVLLELDLKKVIDLLENLYDKWENGTPCHDEDSEYIGNAFKLSLEEEDDILYIIGNDKTREIIDVKRAQKAKKIADNSTER